MSEHAAFCVGVVRDTFCGAHVKEADLTIQVEDSGQCYGIRITTDDPKTTWEEIHAQLTQAKERGEFSPETDCFLALRMPCGKHFCYRTIKDVPLTNVPCTCGDPSHHVIHYEIAP